MSGFLRTRFAALGVKIKDAKHTSIGEGVIFDSMYPESITLGKHVHITMRCVILAHFLDTKQDGIHWKRGEVVFKDNCFIGSRAIIVEGAHVCREAVLGSNAVITGSTHIIDVTGPEPVEYKGYVPPRSVVVPGTYTKKFPAGEYGVSCALIIGKRKESTDKKTSLNDALRDFGVSA